MGTRTESTVRDHLRKEPHKRRRQKSLSLPRILSSLMWREGCFMCSEKQTAHFEDLMRQKCLEVSFGAGAD